MLAIDCPFCGQDNVLPPYLVQAREQQYALELDAQARQRALAERSAAQKRKVRTLIGVLSIAGLLVLALFGSCLALGYSVSKAEKEAKVRAEDPTINGHALILASIERMRRDKHCDRILIQPETFFKTEDKVSLDMIEGAACVHILGATGTGAALSIRYTSVPDLRYPLPGASSRLDYRLCATKTAKHEFRISSASEEPFTVAAIECQRLPSEGGARSKADDPVTSGKARVAAWLADLEAKGCTHVIAEPDVARGKQSYTLTLAAHGPCYNMLLVSHFHDVTFDVSLHDSGGNALFVPAPASEMRLTHCPRASGKYSLVIKPSSGDHWASASVDCPRFGPEGIKRERQLKKQAGKP